MSEKTAVVTIASKNYFAHVNTLMQSLAASNPHMKRYAVVVDEFDEKFAADEKYCNLISLDDLDLPHPKQMEFRYDIMEFNTAVKPFAMRYLLKSYERVIYLDPDIYVYKRLAPVEHAMNMGGQIILTPHFNGIFEEDDLHPDEPDIMRSGVYNLGFIAVQDGQETREMLDWWASRLEMQCVNKQQEGIFVDQKWIDLVPGYFRNVTILHDSGLNVAYWNLSHRQIEKDENGEITINGEPLYFFHFSGLDPHKIDNVSKYQNRFTVKDFGIGEKLFADYAETVLSNRVDEFRKYKYTFADFYDGKKVLPEHRAAYREDYQLQGLCGEDPFYFAKVFYDGEVPRLYTGGVNLIGYICSEHGLGQASRLTAACLDAAGIKWSAYDFEQGNSSRKKDSTYKNRINKYIKYDVSLINVNADQFFTLRRNTPQALWNTYKVGIWYWELPEFPDQWLKAFLDVDEIWAPTKFIADTLDKVAPCPVLHMPPGIYHETPDLKKYNRVYYGLPENAFLFLNMFDVYSYAGRKNPKAVVEAFKMAFSPDDMSVGLVLKLNNSRYSGEVKTTLEDLVGDYRNIYIIAKTLSREAVNGLLCACDAAVSLHRSEGLGLLCEEAMFFGKPVIATGWSGNLDFMDEGNSCLVDYKLVKVGKDIGPYESWQNWADPDVEQASDYMKKLTADKDFYKNVAESAKKTIQEDFSPEYCGERMKERLDWIQEHKGEDAENYGKRMRFFARCITQTLQDVSESVFDAEEKNTFVQQWTEKGYIDFEKVAEAFEKAPVFNADSDREFIKKLYENILHRTPSNDEIDAYVLRMRNGLKRKEVVSGFLSSDEYLGSYAEEYRRSLPLPRKISKGQTLKNWLRSLIA